MGIYALDLSYGWLLLYFPLLFSNFSYKITIGWQCHERKETARWEMYEYLYARPYLWIDFIPFFHAMGN